MHLKKQEITGIKGISFYILDTVAIEETHYFGFNKNNEIVNVISDANNSITLHRDNQDFKSFLSEAVESIGILKWQWQNISEENNLESKDLSIILHIQDKEDLKICGLQAILTHTKYDYQDFSVYSYPENFTQFIKLCQKYDFGPFEIADPQDLSHTEFIV